MYLLFIRFCVLLICQILNSKKFACYKYKQIIIFKKKIVLKYFQCKYKKILLSDDYTPSLVANVH